MNKKTKKILYISLFSLDLLATLFLFILSIVMIATLPKTDFQQPQDNFIGAMQKNPTIFLCAVVIPLFILLAVNIVCLYIYVKKASKKKKVELNDLSDEQLAALKAELTHDLKSPKEENSEEIKAGK